MPLDPKMVGRATEPLPYTYTWRDTVLYALGVGARRAELEYLYEGRGPKVLAGFAVVPTIGPIFDLLGKTGGSIENVVHGAQKITLHAPLAPSGTLSTVARVKGLYDLRRFAIAHIETETRDEHGKPAFDTLWTIIYRDEGGFGATHRRVSAPASTSPRTGRPTSGSARRRAPSRRSSTASRGTSTRSTPIRRSLAASASSKVRSCTVSAPTGT